jgi:hypothetical protein
MDVFNAGRSQRLREHVLIELGVGSRSWEGSDVDDAHDARAV